jgi:hypothetical protein
MLNVFTKRAIYNTFKKLFPSISDINQDLKTIRVITKWRKHGWRTPLPGLLKRAILKQEALQFGASVLVETGTCWGETVWFFRKDMNQIFSIEIQADMVRLARSLFASWANVEIIEGDSASKLAEVIPHIKGPTLFWLDGHYSGGSTGKGALNCPIWKELDSIVKKMRHPYIILIDDARCFGQEQDYPTLEQINAYVGEKLPNYCVSVENDIIRIKPIA